MHKQCAPGTSPFFVRTWDEATQNGWLFMWGAYFCMGAYKRDGVVVIKMGAFIHGVLILCGCLLSRFYSTQGTDQTLFIGLVNGIRRQFSPFIGRG